MLWAPTGAGDFTWRAQSHGTTRPQATMGIIPGFGNGAGTKGSYTQLFSSANVAQDVLGILICVNNANVSTSTSNTLFDVGVDPAGGSSYSILIPDVLATNAPDLTTGGDLHYYFPIWIKSGSSIGIRYDVNGNSGGGVYFYGAIFGRPRDPKNVWCGTYCTGFGLTQSTARGTAVTSGTSSEGSWTSIASSISKDYGYCQAGLGINDGTMTSGGIYALDVAFGDASNKHIIIQDLLYTVPNANETLVTPGRSVGCYRTIKNGNNLYARLQCSGTADSSLGVGMWLVG